MAFFYKLLNKYKIYSSASRYKGYIFLLYIHILNAYLTGKSLYLRFNAIPVTDREGP
jgi:hypothetical protein